MRFIKRIIIWIVALIILAIITLWALGHRSGHGHFEVSIFINRPPAEVFPALINEDMTKKWVSKITSIKELTPGPHRVGTTIVITENINGQTVVMNEEITELKPPYIKRYISRGIGDPSTQFTEYGEYELEPKDGGTVFTMRSQLEYHGLLYRLLEPILTPLVRSKFEGDQKTLKAILEGDAARH